MKREDRKEEEDDDDEDEADDEADEDEDEDEEVEEEGAAVEDWDPAEVRDKSILGNMMMICETQVGVSTQSGSGEPETQSGGFGCQSKLKAKNEKSSEGRRGRLEEINWPRAARKG